MIWLVESKKYGADGQRVQVWNALSELFLDTLHTPADLDNLAERIADTPFCFGELGHILFCEIGPVCFSNTLWLVGGEGLGFGADWLIPKCLERANKNPYNMSTSSTALPLWMHLQSPLYLDAYLMLYRVQRIRDSRV